MKKILFVIVCLAFCLATISAQDTRQTRPRVVPSPAPTIQGDTSGTQRQPPVLIGQTNNQTPNRTEEQPIEEDDEVIRVETNLVTFPVSVLDREDRKSVV